jgi:hypothetical protein
VWQLLANSAAAGRNVSYAISGTQNGVGYDVNTGLRDSGPSVTTAGPVIIESRLTHRQPVTGATVTSILTLPNLTTVNVALADNGIYPDLVAGDGVYTGLYTPNAQGSHSLLVQFSNPNLLARETYFGANISPNPAGGQGVIPADALLAENFSRSQTIQFSIDIPVVDVPPTLTTQPASQSVAAGGSLSFVVTATGSPTPTYQWERKPAGAAAFSAIVNGGVFSGATTGTLTITGATLAMSTDQFRCVVSSSAGTLTSNAATLIVTPGRNPRQEYDGDALSEVVVYRPPTGTWYVNYSSRGYNPATADSFQWGLPGDIAVSGDFDGDGKIELTVFRPSNGTWYIRYSAQGYNIATYQSYQWGLPGDIPVAADFDGDGKTDLTVFRPSTGTWYIRYSSLGYDIGTFGSFQWGLPGDIPLSADFDGDGKTDLVVWRPLNGTWFVRYSSLGYAMASAQAAQWGLPGDIPIASDFDGDGKTELTVWRPSNGTWYVRYSAQGYGVYDAFQWGLPGDLPVATDFDADGKAELTVWRPSNGTWYIRYSSQGYDPGTYKSYQWGLPGDTVPK